MRAYLALHAVVRVLTRLLYRFELHGRPPAEGPYVLAANHESVIDPFVLGLVTRRMVHFLAKDELWKIAWVGRLAERFGGIPISRGRGDRDALARAERILRDGGIVAIFPQGRVRWEGPWYRGAAKLALATGVPIVPVRLVNTGKAVSRGLPGLPRVSAVVGEPIAVEPAPSTIAAARELTDRVRAAIDALPAPD